MRLEDWQKWLDSQFIDPATVNRPPESVSDIAAPPDLADQPHGDGPDAAISPDSTVKVNADGAHDEAARTADVPAVVQFAGQADPISVESAINVGPSAEPLPGRPAGMVEDVQIPSIENYLPFLKGAQTPASVANIPTAPAAPMQSQKPEPEVESASANVAAPDEPAASTRSEAAPISSAEVSSGPVEPPAIAKEEVTSPDPSAQSESSTAAARKSDPPPVAEPIRRAPARPAGTAHRRALPGRTKFAEIDGGDLAGGALWELVPKHIQTLVALDSDEVTQNSYKRAFKESRIELVSKLLDPTLSLEETARLLNVCPTTVRRYTNRGLLSHQRTSGDQRRFKLSDVLAFLEGQSRADATPD